MYTWSRQPSIFICVPSISALQTPPTFRFNITQPHWMTESYCTQLRTIKKYGQYKIAPDAVTKLSCNDCRLLDEKLTYTLLPLLCPLQATGLCHVHGLCHILGLCHVLHWASPQRETDLRSFLIAASYPFFEFSQSFRLWLHLSSSRIVIFNASYPEILIQSPNFIHLKTQLLGGTAKFMLTG